MLLMNAFLDFIHVDIAIKKIEKFLSCYHFVFIYMEVIYF